MFVFIDCMLSLGITSFLFEVEINREMKNNLNSINKISEKRDNLLQIVKELSDFVEIHSMMKQLSKFQK